MASPAGGALTWPDYTVLAVSLLGLIAIGWVFSREQSGTSDFFSPGAASRGGPRVCPFSPRRSAR
jgi:Na+/proline symporter